MSRHLLEQAKECIEGLVRECHIVTQEGGEIETLLSDLQRELDIGRKYRTGNYLILRFDEFGAKIATVLSDAPGLTGAQAQAKREIEEGICASAVVMMVCWNSRDRQVERWEAK